MQLLHEKAKKNHNRHQNTLSSQKKESIVMAGMQNYGDPIPHVNRASNVFTKDKLLVDRKMFASILSKGIGLKNQAQLQSFFQAEKYNQLTSQVQKLRLMAGASIPM